MTSITEGAAQPFATRAPVDRIGDVVLRDLVETIVTGRVAPGEFLPPEGPLSQSFGVSRTVIREAVKRLQEKGIVAVAQGRGTSVKPMSEWNVLDPLVLETLIAHDTTLGVLDDLSVVRGALESVIAAEVAGRGAAEDAERMRAALEEMRAVIDDEERFREADARFHEALMAMSENRLAPTIAHALFARALASTRYRGLNAEHGFAETMAEHEAICAAIDAGDADDARAAMDRHIRESWQRRRLPTERDRG